MYELRDDYKCHEKNHKLFCRLTEKLLCDPCLMPRGFDAYGTFYSNAAQSIAVEAPALFNLAFDYKGLEWTPGSSNITVKDPGVYSIFGEINTVQVAQFSVFVNGSPLLGSVVGINKGASVLSSRVITELKTGT